MTNSADYFRKLSRWFGALAALGLILLAFVHDDALAAETKRNVRFDHVKTGFPLTGAHHRQPVGHAPARPERGRRRAWP